MHPIDEFLAAALLRDDLYIPRDVVPRHAEDHTLLPMEWGPHGSDADEHTAARYLLTLCETVVARTAAEALQDFLTNKIPGPPGARVLGCILQLADAADSARFWWQYAAGAGDDAASYCLYLHHLALGEAEAAAWWRHQTQVDTDPAPETTPLSSDRGRIRNLDSSTTTVLRVLGKLHHEAAHPRSELTDAVIDYVPAAVAAGQLGNPDIDIPLPADDFAGNITIILAVTSSLAAPDAPAHGEPCTTPRLSRRKRPTNPTANASRPERPPVKYLQPR
ncbi:hypothetical protein ACFCXH_01025 [Streptomyces nojiriensis]|uniref:hypothetical protein n=1 Tax=Streptomyces nojiriensis TaxID=66374 RepID=UPI0035D58C71